MRTERVLVILCGVILLATVLAVSLPSQTTLALRDQLSISPDGEAAAVDGPTFDSSVLLPAIYQGTCNR